MADALNTVMKMYSEGKTDAEVVMTLREQGLAAQDISDAINQAKVKQELSVAPPAMGLGLNPKTQGMPGMQQSIMEASPMDDLPVPSPAGRKSKTIKTDQPTVTMTMADTAPLAQPAQAPAQPSFSQADYYSPQQPQYNYYQQPAASQSAGVDLDTIEEIAEEIVSEKFEEFKSKVGDIAEFKSLLQSRVQDLDDRIKRIENVIDKMQIAITGKLQEYSQGIKAVGSEMVALETAFGDILNPLVDNVKELGRITEKLREKSR